MDPRLVRRRASEPISLHVNEADISSRGWFGNAIGNQDKKRVCLWYAIEANELSKLPQLSEYKRSEGEICFCCEKELTRSGDLAVKTDETVQACIKTDMVEIYLMTNTSTLDQFSLPGRDASSTSEQIYDVNIIRFTLKFHLDHTRERRMLFYYCSMLNKPCSAGVFCEY